MNNEFDIEKKNLDENLMKLKKDREYNLNLKRLYDDKIIFLSDKITHFTEHNNSLKKSIKKVKKEIKDLQYYCEYKVEEYENEHKKNYNSICGGNISNNKIEICKNKMKKWNMKKLNCKLLFMEKYNIYLGEFYEICNKYGEKENGIIKDCIIFTREQVEDKINELEIGVKNLENKYYEVNDEDIIKNDYEEEIIKLEENYKLKIENRKKEIEKILNSVKNVIEQYKKQKKLKSREEIMEYIDDLKKQKAELEYINEDLKEKYKNLIEIKLNIEPNCLEKLNIMKADSLKEIFLKKKECVEN